jgi:hypothetical protein
MKLTKGKLAKIHKKKNESHRTNKGLKHMSKNITASAWKQKQNYNLHNKTLKKVTK